LVNHVKCQSDDLLPLWHLTWLIYASCRKLKDHMSQVSSCINHISNYFVGLPLPTLKAIHEDIKRVSRNLSPCRPSFTVSHKKSLLIFSEGGELHNRTVPQYGLTGMMRSPEDYRTIFEFDSLYKMGNLVAYKVWRRQINHQTGPFTEKVCLALYAVIHVVFLVGAVCITYQKVL
jgi:hypothetical protein